MRRETRLIKLVPISEDGLVVVDYEDGQWVDSIAPYNETYAQVIIGEGPWDVPDEDDIVGEAI